MSDTFKSAILFTIGGLAYFIIELLYRGYSHWTMFLVGGLCFLWIGLINEVLPWELGIIIQGIIGSCIVTFIELITGIFVNVLLGMNVWNYSNLPFNIMGQICLPFSILWIFLSIGAIIIDDWLRYKLFNEEKPHYKL